MPPIELGPTRPIGAVSAGIARQSGGRTGSSGQTDDATSAVSLSDAVSPGQPPVDSDRVEVIRKAVETGQYPVVPAKIADAMIAAGLLLREGK